MDAVIHKNEYDNLIVTLRVQKREESDFTPKFSFDSKEKLFEWADKNSIQVSNEDEVIRCFIKDLKVGDIICWLDQIDMPETIESIDFNDHHNHEGYNERVIINGSSWIFSDITILKDHDKTRRTKNRELD